MSLEISKLSLRPPRTLSFDLRKEVGVITSHFTWLEELVPFIEQASLELAEPDQNHQMKGYVKMLLQHEKLSDDDDHKECEDEEEKNEDDDEEEDVKSDSTIGFIALKINRATMFAYVSDFGTAIQEVQEVRGHLKHLADPGHRKISEYLVDAIEWVIGLLEKLEKGQGGLPEDHFDKVATLCERWDDFKPDVDAKTQAVVAFIKGCLAAALNVEHAKVWSLFLQATKLDPFCHSWFHYAYRKMRKIRQRTGGQPQGEEIRLCITAYKLRPKNDIVTVLDYGILLKERWWREPIIVWDEHEKDYLLSQQLFEEALSKAKESNKTRFAYKAKYYLAELLLFGKGRKLDQFKGYRLLLECLKERPKDTTVLHKAAKLFHNGSFGSHRWKNPVRAEEYYKRAIGDEASNSPCLMGYLHLLEERKEYGKLMNVVEKGIQFGKRDSYVARLYAIKGRLLWHSSRKKACDSWIHVVESFPDYSFEAYRAIYEPSEVISILEKMKEWPEYKNKHRLIAEFVKELQRKIAAARNPAVDAHRGIKPKYGGSRPKPLVVDRGGSTYSMRAGKGKGGMIRN